MDDSAEHEFNPRAASPALKKAIDSTDQRDINSSCMVAMAKIGQNHPEFKGGYRWQSEGTSCTLIGFQSQDHKREKRWKNIYKKVHSKDIIVHLISSA